MRLSGRGQPCTDLYSSPNTELTTILCCCVNVAIVFAVSVCSCREGRETAMNSVVYLKVNGRTSVLMLHKMLLWGLLL